MNSKSLNSCCKISTYLHSGKSLCLHGRCWCEDGLPFDFSNV